MTSTVSLDRILDHSPGLRGPLKGARRAAASEAPILILGAPGTGRTTLARALHQASSRAAGPLVEVDCGVIPAELFESELFGHRPGAFSGATVSRAGRVALAEGGSLLLDHLEELPLTTQAKLLRLLSEGRYSPLGGREGKADVRFLAVGPEDLASRVDAGAFREDLFYRLEVLTFHLLPLSRRRGDILSLAHAVLDDLGRRFQRPSLRLSEAAESWLSAHPWPGNLTELRHTLERELILTLDTGTELLDPKPPASAQPPPVTLAEAEAAHLRRVLAHTRGHQGKAAELLGISRKGLWEKRRKYGIP